MEHQVFISYSADKGDSTGSKDRQAADMICSRLESKGIRCWIAYRDILPGEDWLDAIIDAVEKSKILVLVFSSNTNKSSWVVKEVTRALREGLTIIPFRIEDVSPVKGLRILDDCSQWMDAYTLPFENHLNKLTEVVCQHLGKEPEKPVEFIEKSPEAKREAVKIDEKRREKRPLRWKWILYPVVFIALIAFVFIFKDYWITKKPRIRPDDGKKMPEDLEFVKSKAQRVYENENGYWEADYGDGIVMVYIPPGEFTMGLNDNGREEPPHQVYLDGYWMGKYEVTFDQYDKYCGETDQREPDDEDWGRGKRPVINVSCDDAAAYCNWLSKEIGLKFILPREAQWEKAARGTEGGTYPWGVQKPDEDLANFGRHTGKTLPVGSYPQGESPYGLLDMAGNVWEWCIQDGNENSPDKNPRGPGPEGGVGPVLPVLRGGSWDSDTASLRCAVRHFIPFPGGSAFGFRLCAAPLEDKGTGEISGRQN